MRYRASGKYFLREIAGETLLVSVAEDCINGMVTFNETGAFLWRRLEEGCTPEGLVSALQKEYDVPEAVAKADVARFIENAVRCGMAEQDI